MSRNDNTACDPRTEQGFIPGSFAADYLDPDSLPRPPEAWHVLTPADLVPLHKFLVQQAASLAVRGNATRIANRWSAAAAIIADLRFAWATRIHDIAAAETLREAAEQTVAATLSALRYEHSADVRCWEIVAKSWIAQLRMSPVPHRKQPFARRLLGILAPAPCSRCR